VQARFLRRRGRVNSHFDEIAQNLAASDPSRDSLIIAKMKRWDACDLSLVKRRVLQFTSVVFACTVFASAMLAGSLRNEELRAQFQDLARGFDGRVGICAQGGSGTACVNGDQRFSLQSVMKLLVALAVMDAVDHRGWNLNEPLLVRRQDLSLFVQPIAKLVTDAGYPATMGDLLRRAIVDSDSAATDILVGKLGGQAAVQAFLDRHAITGVRFDRDERHLQTEILGLEWRPEFVDAAVLDAAIAAVPDDRRDQAYRRYQADPRDTATPKGMALLLYSLAQGKLLSPESTKHLLDVMSGTVTFPDRLKAGVPDGWRLAHKTGTSGSWKGVTAATNDVGVLTAPDGGKVSIAVFVGDSQEPSAKRASLMARAASLTVAHYR
jgi:beta-lactamase class A